MPSQRRSRPARPPSPRNTSVSVVRIPPRPSTKGLSVHPTDDQLLGLGRAYQAGLSRRRCAEYIGVSDFQLLHWFDGRPDLEQQLLQIRAEASLERLEIAEKKAREEDSKSMLNFIRFTDPDFSDHVTVDHNVSVDPEHGKLVVEFRKDWPSA